MKPLQKMLKKKSFNTSLIANQKFKYSILKYFELPLVNEIPIKTIEG